jgi:hypothetical protein
VFAHNWASFSEALIGCQETVQQFVSDGLADVFSRIVEDSNPSCEEDSPTHMSNVTFQHLGHAGCPLDVAWPRGLAAPLVPVFGPFPITVLDKDGVVASTPRVVCIGAYPAAPACSPSSASRVVFGDLVCEECDTIDGEVHRVSMTEALSSGHFSQTALEAWLELLQADGLADVQLQQGAVIIPGRVRVKLPNQPGVCRGWIVGYKMNHQRQEFVLIEKDTIDKPLCLNWAYVSPSGVFALRLADLDFCGGIPPPSSSTQDGCGLKNIHRWVTDVLVLSTAMNEKGWHHLPRRTPLGWIVGCSVASDDGSLQVLVKRSQIVGHGALEYVDSAGVPDPSLEWIPLAAFKESIKAAGAQVLWPHIDACIAFLVSDRCQISRSLVPGALVRVPQRRRDAALCFYNVNNNGGKAAELWSYTLYEPLDLARLSVPSGGIPDGDPLYWPMKWLLELLVSVGALRSRLNLQHEECLDDASVVNVLQSILTVNQTKGVGMGDDARRSGVMFVMRVALMCGVPEGSAFLVRAQQLRDETYDWVARDRRDKLLLTACTSAEDFRVASVIAVGSSWATFGVRAPLHRLTTVKRCPSQPPLCISQGAALACVLCASVVVGRSPYRSMEPAILIRYSIFEWRL